MPEAQCVKYPVKPGRSEALVNGIAHPEDRRTELLEAMAAAGLLAEAVFLERSDRGDHILIYTRAQDLRAGMEALSNSKLPLIKAFNRLLTESVDLENAITLELIYHTP